MFSQTSIKSLTDYNNKNIVEEYTVEYYKNNIKNTDNIYLILTDNIKYNLQNIKAKHIFLDCTYKIIPPALKRYKFFVILGYDENKNKLILYLFSLIRHENKETFETIFKILKIKYEFNPIFINTDYQKGQIGAIINVFPNSTVILCWFHALRNIKLKIPFLNSKNTTERNVSKDIIANIKLLFFIPEKYIQNFYQDIKNAYNIKSYSKFYKYMDKFINRDYKGIKYLWNFNKLINNNLITENQYFVKNNFVERSNRTLNQNLIYKKSSYANFRNTILNTDYYFQTKNEYDLNAPNLSKAIIYYIKNSNYLENNNKKVKLIDYNFINNIYATYVEIVKKTGINMFDNIEQDDFSIENTTDIIDDENSATSEDSSDEEQSNVQNEENINNNNHNDKGGNNGNDDDEVDIDNKNKDNKVYPKTNNKIINGTNNKKKKKKNYNYPKNSDFIELHKYIVKNINQYNSKGNNSESTFKYKLIRPRKRNYITMIMENKRFSGIDEKYEETNIKKFYFKKLFKKSKYLDDLDCMMSKLNIK